MRKVYVCSKCKKLFFGNIFTVTAESRKNKLGRIAWGRDALCDECRKKEAEQATKGAQHDRERQAD